MINRCKEYFNWVKESEMLGFNKRYLRTGVQGVLALSLISGCVRDGKSEQIDTNNLGVRKMDVTFVTPAPEEVNLSEKIKIMKSSSSSLMMIPPTRGSRIPLNFGEEQSVQVRGLTHLPDGHTSFLRRGTELNVWISAEVHGYLLTGQGGIEDLMPWYKSGEGNLKPTPVIGPDRARGGDNYASFGSVLKLGNGEELVGFYHAEEWENQARSFPFIATVGRAISRDFGRSWEKEGVVISGMEVGSFRDNRVYGAGQPSVVIKDNFIYSYYVDWNKTHSDAIHLARSPVSRRGEAGSWEKYTLDGFKKITEGLKSQPVIQAPEEAGYSALPSVSYNTKLGKMLAVFETNVGFFAGISDDGIKWSELIKIAEFPQTMGARRTGDTWYSYPSLLSFESESDQVTGESGVLFYSKGEWNRGAHFLHFRPFKMG